MIRKICEWLSRRLPKRVIGRDGEVYLERYYLFGKDPPYPEDYVGKKPKARLTFLPTVYLHHFLMSDTDEELHNHPWNGLSVILLGGYSEERRVPENCMGFGMDTWVRREYKPWSINRIGKDDFHRVDLYEKDCWTLFIIGEKQQSWGFWNRHTDEYTDWREFLERKRIERDTIRFF